MAKTRFGTNSFAALDVSKGAHLIEDSALVQSTNGWTDEEGVLSCSLGKTLLHSGYGDISCFAAGRQGGEDKLAWMDGDDVYVGGTDVGTINAGGTMVAKDFDDKFFFFNILEVAFNKRILDKNLDKAQILSKKVNRELN